MTWATNLEQAEIRLRLEPPLVLIADIEVDCHARLSAELRQTSPWARVLRIGELTGSELELPASADDLVVPKPFDASELAEL